MIDIWKTVMERRSQNSKAFWQNWVRKSFYKQDNKTTEAHRMRVNVTEQGLVIPKEFLTEIQAVEIRRDRDQIILTSSAETPSSQRKDMFGIWQEQIWMADNFDAPLDEFGGHI
jgi:hypothetical protein